MFNLDEEVVRLDYWRRTGVIVEINIEDNRARVKWESELNHDRRRIGLNPIRTWVNFKFLKRLTDCSREELQKFRIS